MKKFAILNIQVVQADKPDVWVRELPNEELSSLDIRELMKEEVINSMLEFAFLTDDERKETKNDLMQVHVIDILNQWTEENNYTASIMIIDQEGHHEIISYIT